MITVALRHEPTTLPKLVSAPESVRIIAEIAERLDELEELRRYHAVDLINRLHAVGQVSPRLLRVVIALMHGRSEVVSDSYHVQGDRRGLTKQAICIEYLNDLQSLRRYFPEVVHCVEAIRASALAHEDGMSHADALREATHVES